MIILQYIRMIQDSQNPVHDLTFDFRSWLDIFWFLFCLYIFSSTDSYATGIFKTFYNSSLSLLCRPSAALFIRKKKKKKKISELNKRKYSPTVRVLILLESGERNNTFIWLSWYKLKAFSLISFQFRIENATSLRNILIIWQTIQYICGNQKFYHQSVTWKQTCSFTCSAQRRASWALLVMHN